MNLIKKTVTAIAAIISLTTLASPARLTPFTITLADGQVVEVVKCGDEHKHWLTSTATMHDAQPEIIVKHADNKYYIATDEERLALVSQPEAKRRTRQNASSQTPSFPTTGEMHSLVLLVNFSDKKFLSTTAQNDFQRMINEDGYEEAGATGSARDYYIENSMGLFQPQFDVVGPITVSQGYAYYGENAANGEDKHATDMIIEACQIADETVDFSLYDYNNDGFIDNVFVFYAGYGEATTNMSNTIWPHSFNITEYTSEEIMFDGVRLDHYACTNELDSDGKMDGIGTFVHEFGHVLGLPDLYPTNYTYAFSPNEWSVMDQGEYNNNSRTPPYLSVYERYALGWINPLEISEPASATLNNISKNQGYIINTINPNEYFMLENRQQQRWDQYIPGHGMLVWHIDYDPTIWEKNTVNNTPYHQRVDIVEADNTPTLLTRSADSFPGTSNITAFTSETTPALADWGGRAIDVPLSGIREENGIIYFDICGGGEPLHPIKFITPVAEEATSITQHSFVAHWQQVDEVDGYLLNVGQMELGEDYEDIIDFTGGINALPDWCETTCTSVYNNSAYSGEATPSIRMQNEGQYISIKHDAIYDISFWCRGTSVADGTTIEIEWSDADGNIVLTHNEPYNGKETTLSFEAPESDKNIARVQITYRPAQGSASVAVDDIRLNCADLELHAIREPIFTTDTQQLVDNLEDETDYSYTVTAVKDNMQSRVSNIINVHTRYTDGISDVHHISDRNAWFNLKGQRVSPDQMPRHTILIHGGKKVTT